MLAAVRKLWLKRLDANLISSIASSIELRGVMSHLTFLASRKGPNEYSCRVGGGLTLNGVVEGEKARPESGLFCMQSLHCRPIRALVINNFNCCLLFVVSPYTVDSYGLCCAS